MRRRAPTRRPWGEEMLPCPGDAPVYLRERVRDRERRGGGPLEDDTASAIGGPRAAGVFVVEVGGYSAAAVVAGFGGSAAAAVAVDIIDRA
nr:unnamed protein product [Digitaria exilis]